jgi:ferredoxin--NADP+ reductase
MNQQQQELGPVSEAVVVDSARVSRADVDEVRRLRLRIPDPAFRVAAGQTVGVIVPGPHPFGNRYHMRRYSVAGLGLDAHGDLEIELLVRRCFAIDEVSGEACPGIASNYLCDAMPGRAIQLSGPYRSPFTMPRNESANLLMIGTGTGVAPFRGLLQAIYRQRGGWSGQVRLYYGARTGMDMLYANDEHDDLAQYYDQETFEAFRALGGRPLADETDILAGATVPHAAAIWDFVRLPDTYVYLAGLGRVAQRFDAIMGDAAGSVEHWATMRDSLEAAGRWAQLVYD